MHELILKRCAVNKNDLFSAFTLAQYYSILYDVIPNKICMHFTLQEPTVNSFLSRPPHNIIIVINLAGYSAVFNAFLI